MVYPKNTSSVASACSSKKREETPTSKLTNWNKRRKGQTTAMKENRKRKDLPLGNLRDCGKRKKTNKAYHSCVNKFKEFCAAY